jgi:hypothetical protein
MLLNMKELSRHIFDHIEQNIDPLFNAAKLTFSE